MLISKQAKTSWKSIVHWDLGPVCLLESSFLLESEFRGKWIPGKWIPGKYFSMFGSLMESKLENTFPVFGYVMENELENNLLMFYFSQVY
jgi:hypothetical protein